MKILGKYLLKEFLRVAAACLVGFLVLYLVIDFVENADRLIQYNAAPGEILRYYLFRIPGVFYMISPVAVLMAVLITVSLRGRANEFTAMFSAGVSPLRVFLPLVAGCALVSALSLVCSEFLAPEANRHAREISSVRIRPGRVAAQFSLNRYWLRGENSILSAQVVDAGGRKLQGFQYLEVDRELRLLRRIDAKTAESAGGGSWTLRDGREREFSGEMRASGFPVRTYAFPETIQGFLDGETPPEEMTYAQLSGYIGDSKAKGFDVRRYEVDLQAKLSYPLLNIILSLIAIPLALRAPRSGGVWRSIGAGLLVGFLCWMALSASLSLGRKGLLLPAAAAWLPDLLFAAAGALLLRRRHA